MRGLSVTAGEEPPLGNWKKALVLQNDNAEFAAFDGTTDVKANQCWLECDVAEANKLVLCFDEVTGIHAVPSISLESDKCIYNIAGQRLSQPQAGLNIVGDKKVLVH